MVFVSAGSGQYAVGNQPWYYTLHQAQCGTQTFNESSDCEPGDITFTYYSLPCEGCHWGQPSCAAGSCQTCVNNECQYQCGVGYHCEADSCCANGCSPCQAQCSSWCGAICIACAPDCPNGQRPACNGSNPYCYGSPIVLDPFDEGFHLTSNARGVRFREIPGGPLRQISWTDRAWRNGWLVLDRNGNGRIDNLTELFGDLTPQPPSEERNGFRALAVFDEPANGGDGNGFINPTDAVYSLSVATTESGPMSVLLRRGRAG
jgi:hypothetical protein